MKMKQKTISEGPTGWKDLRVLKIFGSPFLMKFLVKSLETNSMGGFSASPQIRSKIHKNENSKFIKLDLALGLEKKGSVAQILVMTGG